MALSGVLFTFALYAGRIWAAWCFWTGDLFRAAAWQFATAKEDVDRSDADARETNVYAATSVAVPDARTRQLWAHMHWLQNGQLVEVVSLSVFAP